MSTKALNQRQVWWSEILSGFNFRIVFRPGSKAIRLDALSRRPGDRPAKTDLDDDCIKNRQCTILPPELFKLQDLPDSTGRSGAPNSAGLQDTFNSDQLQDLLDQTDLVVAPIDIILPAIDKPIDDLITQGYQRSSIAQAMITALGDPHLKRWPKALRKEL
jgi:hypothetical protein